MDPLRDRLIREATHLFVERGFDGASMRDIAAACGVTKASLYYHYPSKADLLRDIVGTYLDAISTAMAQARQSGPESSDQLRAIITELFSLPPEGRAVIRLAMHDLRHLEEADQIAFGTAYHDQFLQPMADIIHAGTTTGEFQPHDPMTMVWIILGMLYPFLTTAPSSRNEPQVMTELLDVLLNGLKAR